MGEMASATEGATTISSTTENADQIRAALTDQPVPESATPQAAEPPAELGEQPPAEPAPESEAGRQLQKRKRSLQDRIDEITHEKYATQRERDTAVAERDELRAQLAALKQPKAQPPAAPPDPTDPEPTLDKFETYEQYVKAQARWEARQEWKERERGQQEQAYLQRHAEYEHAVKSNWATRMNAAKAADPGLLERIDPQLLQFSPVSALPPGSRFDFRNVVAEVVAQSQVPDKLLVYMTEHPEFVQRLSTLYPDALHREMGKLEARFEAAPSGPASQPPPLSKAKPPIKPVDSSPSTVDDDTESLPLAELAKRRRLESRRG